MIMVVGKFLNSSSVGLFTGLNVDIEICESISLYKDCNQFILEFQDQSITFPEGETKNKTESKRDGSPSFFNIILIL